MEVYGTYLYSRFFNADSGSAAFAFLPEQGTCEEYKNENGIISVSGNFCLQQKGLPMCLEGDWRTTEYGQEFQFNKVKLTSKSMEDTKNFLSNSGVVITPVNIQKILKVTGADIFAAAENTDIEETICESTNADCVSVVQVFAKIRNLQRELELFYYLDKYGGTFSHCTKILKKYPQNAIEVIRSDPYSIVANAGIPFSLADRIGLDNGIEPLSDTRIKAILLWCIHKESNSGNVFMTFDGLCKSVSKLPGTKIPNTAVAAALKDHPYILKEETEQDVYYEAYLMQDEKLAAKEFARIMLTRFDLPFHPEYIERIEEEQGRPFGTQQKEAFQLLRSTGFKLLVGDPGTGKTTTVNGLLRYLEMLWEDQYGRKPLFALCAPAGRAAQRMKEATNRHASTIHKLIEYQPYGDKAYYKNGEDPIDADVIVIDEVSMLGLSTFSKLIAAIKNGSLVLLVGDVNQLQSVEPGCVLQDIINCGIVDMCHLTELFRQAAESGININAKKIIEGDENLVVKKDFQLIQSEPEQTKERLISVIKDLIRETGDPNKIQVLAPVKKGSCGVNEGNRTLQEIFNSAKGGIWYGYNKNYKLNDRVIMMSNNYSLGYYNGDVGYIRFITDSSMRIEIGDETITLPREQFGDMDLAYNCTVHKSQGSEYDYLVIVLQEEAKGMLDRNLFYTAVTRGKKKVIVLYEKDAIHVAVTRKRSGTRKSLLVKRIWQELHI